MITRENLSSITHEARQIMFEFKYKKQLSAMEDAAKNGNNFVIFTNNEEELPTPFVEWLFTEGFKIFGESHTFVDEWVSIIKNHEYFSTYHKIKVEW